MELELFHLDAFSDRVFAGNPAAVVPLKQWLADDTLAAIAAENNLSETAFVVPDERADFHIRWFTPSTEVDLCGHATLAAAWVLFHKQGFAGDQISFHSASGLLTVTRRDDLLALDFPARPGRPVPPPANLFGALGIKGARQVLQARDTLVVLDNEAAVRSLRPDFAALKRLDTFAVMVTAPGDDCDFVCRFFAPAQGLDEDPVTGSAYCTLAPYWSAELGRETLHARQLSARGGEVFCRHQGERVEIAGRACCYMSGRIALEGSEAPAT
jgi:PhzF family phenazine biosynthesis protein